MEYIVLYTSSESGLVSLNIKLSAYQQGKREAGLSFLSACSPDPSTSPGV